MPDRPLHPSELREEHTLHYFDDERNLAIEVVVSVEPGSFPVFTAYGYDDHGEEKFCGDDYWEEVAREECRAKWTG